MAWAWCRAADWGSGLVSCFRITHPARAETRQKKCPAAPATLINFMRRCSDATGADDAVLASHPASKNQD